MCLEKNFMKNGESNSQFTMQNYVKSFGASFLFAITDRVRLIELEQKKGACDEWQEERKPKKKLL